MILLRISCVILLLAGLAACSKEKLLDAQPNSDMLVPTTLDGFQTLLDKDAIISENPILGELSADNFYLTDGYWQSLKARERNAYVWAKDIFVGQGDVDDWNLSYKQIFYANVALEGADKIPVTAQNEQQWKAIKGAALFIRAYAFYNVSQVFAAVYDSKSAGTELGIPLRLTANVDEESVRGTLKQTYEQVLQDLIGAAGLLPVGVDIEHRNRPCRPAALAMLARVYLSMREYTMAGAYADSCLQLYDTLIDYNKVNVTASYPFSRLNGETLYQSKLISTCNALKGRVAGCIVDSVLYQSYDPNDLRKQAFYTSNAGGPPNIKSGYNGSIFLFGGVAVDEAYLIRAESRARAGYIIAAMEDLNTLLKKRWKAGSFIPYTAVSANAALQQILAERRKELAFRGLRWTDLRRLNKEGAQIIPARLVNKEGCQLLPDDPRYVLPIPPDVIALSGIRQNPR